MLKEMFLKQSDENDFYVFASNLFCQHISPVEILDMNELVLFIVAWIRILHKKIHMRLYCTFLFEKQVHTAHNDFD